MLSPVSHVVQLGFDLTSELVVSGVGMNSPAAKAGLRVDQRLLSVDESPVSTLGDVRCVHSAQVLTFCVAQLFCL